MTFNFTNPAAKFSANLTTGKTFIKQVKRTATGILSIALLSSTMVVATVSASPAEEIEHVSEAVLAGMCKRSKGNFLGSRNLFDNVVSSYSCVVKYPDGSAIVVTCHENRGCEGNRYKKDIEVDLCGRTTLGKPDPIIPSLCKSKSRNGSLIQK